MWFVTRIPTPLFPCLFVLYQRSNFSEEQFVLSVDLLHNNPTTFYVVTYELWKVRNETDDSSMFIPIKLYPWTGVTSIFCTSTYRCLITSWGLYYIILKRVDVIRKVPFVCFCFLFVFRARSNVLWTVKKECW